MEKSKIGNSSNHNQNNFNDLIWVGISSLLLQLVDRLENRIIYFDFNINLIGKVIFIKVFPEFVTNDPLGIYFFTVIHIIVFIAFDNKS